MTDHLRGSSMPQLLHCTTVHKISHQKQVHGMVSSHKYLIWQPKIVFAVTDRQVHADRAPITTHFASFIWFQLFSLHSRSKYIMGKSKIIYYVKWLQKTIIEISFQGSTSSHSYILLYLVALFVFPLYSGTRYLGIGHSISFEILNPSLTAIYTKTDHFQRSVIPNKHVQSLPWTPVQNITASDI